jgi:hypothetical protein
MKKLSISILFVLSSFFSFSQKVVKDATGNYVAIHASKDSTGSSAKPTGKTFTDSKGNVYPVLSLAFRRIENLEERIKNTLLNSSGRLTLNAAGNIEYCTGQYFPTEYRPAANRLLSNLIWADYRDEKDSAGNPVYKDGHEIRKAIKRNISRRVMKNYFN